jgi:hypothetical protein
MDLVINHTSDEVSIQVYFSPYHPPNLGDTFNSTTGSSNLVLVNRIRNEIGTYGVLRDTILPGSAIRRIIGALSSKVKDWHFIS